MIEAYEQDAYLRLVDAILAQTIKDYITATIRHNNDDVRECERFIRSRWFTDLTDIDPASFLYNCKMAANEEVKKRYHK